LLALKNLSNGAVKMITERGTSECLIILGAMKQILATAKYSGGLFCFVFLAIEKNEGLLKF